MASGLQARLLIKRAHERLWPPRLPQQRAARFLHPQDLCLQLHISGADASVRVCCLGIARGHLKSHDTQGAAQSPTQGGYIFWDTCICFHSDTFKILSWSPASSSVGRSLSVSRHAATQDTATGSGDSFRKKYRRKWVHMLLPRGPRSAAYRPPPCDLPVTRLPRDTLRPGATTV